ncbi:MAG: GNAT family N-acetyltransferase [Bacteroidia bacterium]
MNIRKVQQADNPSLANIIKETFEEHNAPKEGTVYSDPTTNNLFELFKNKKSILWVAEEKGEILGCCGIYPTDGLPNECVELVKFYLSVNARGQGIGTKLMEQSIESAIELGYSELYLETLPHFDKAVKMYEKLGFKELEKPIGKSGHVSCNIWMIKKLQDK